LLAAVSRLDCGGVAASRKESESVRNSDKKAGSMMSRLSLVTER
jgi:hypothetical protein